MKTFTPQQRRAMLLAFLGFPIGWCIGLIYALPRIDWSPAADPDDGPSFFLAAGLLGGLIIGIVLYVPLYLIFTGCIRRSRGRKQSPKPE